MEEITIKLTPEILEWYERHSQTDFETAPVTGAVFEAIQQHKKPKLPEKIDPFMCPESGTRDYVYKNLEKINQIIDYLTLNQ